MPGLRDEITKTLLRFSRVVPMRPAAGTRSNKPPSVADSALRDERKLGVYRILKHLGAGGMGHVYLALDTRLGRHVALKFLPPDLTSDEEMLRRLEAEAQTASRLNHPNILTIYDIGHLEGEYYIASEYINGATLRSAIERDVIDPATAIDVVSQILSALVAAHAAGVVHRDLKPGNIMIRPDGYVKVIDFGLAKQTLRTKADRIWEQAITRPGAIVGTVDYMSPEQANGQPLDQRTDLWSVGVILYETLTHQRPFEGDTEHHVFVNILEKPVPPLPELPELPAGLADVVRKALTKDRDGRYQTACEMLTDLQAIQRSSHVGSSVRELAVEVKSRNWNLPALSGILFAVLIALGLVWWFMQGRNQLFEPDWFRVDSVRRLTFNGQAVEACLSPDGKYLAFAAGDASGPQTLYLSQLSAASEEVKIPAEKVSYIGLSFSPDNELYVVSEDSHSPGKLYRVPLIGKPEGRPILVGIDGPVAFSPKGDRFAFVRRARGRNESTIFIASRDGSEIHKLFSTTDWTIIRQIAWSPKGDQVAAILFNDVSDHVGRPLLDLVDLAGNEHRLPLPDWQKAGLISWTKDARSMILSAAYRTEAPNQGQLRQIDLHHLRVQDITKDLAGYRSASLTKDENYLAAIKEEVKVNAWVSLPNDFSRGQSTMAEAERHPNLSWANDNQLLLNSQRNGYPNLWLFNIESQARTNLTSEPFVEQDAVPVPGSKMIVFSSNRAGEYKLWKFNPETNIYKQLTFGAGYDEAPSVTPDGHWIVYTSWNSVNPHLRRISIDGGESAQIGTYSAKWPQVSPDGKLIACSVVDLKDSTSSVAVIPFDGSAVKLIPNVQAPFRWYDNQVLVAADNREGLNLWSVPLNGPAAHLLTQFTDKKILNFAFSPNRNRLACLRGSVESDVNLFIRRTPK